MAATTSESSPPPPIPGNPPANPPTEAEPRTSEDDDSALSSSYIDYLAFLSPTFSPPSFANILTLQTNTPHDPSLDLSTPLSRITFDIQEIDSHITSLTTKSALPLLEYAQRNQLASTQLVDGLESELARLTETYTRLEADVITRAKSATELYTVCSRLHETTTMLRLVTRTLLLGRELESQMFEVRGIPTIERSQSRISESDSFRAMPRAARTAVELQKVLLGGSRDVDNLDIIRSLKKDYVQPALNQLVNKASVLISNFSTTTSSNAGKAGGLTSIQLEESRTKLIASFQTLQILSAIDKSAGSSGLLIKAVQDYVHSQARAFFEGLKRGGLTEKPSMERSLADLEARTKSITFLENVLHSISHTDSKPSTKPITTTTTDSDSEEDDETTEAPPSSTLLTPVLTALDAPTLPTAFFRTIAKGLETRVNDVLQRGGNNARMLRSLRQVLREGLREAVKGGLSEGERRGRSGAEVGVCVGVLGQAVAGLFK